MDLLSPHQRSIHPPTTHHNNAPPKIDLLLLEKNILGLSVARNSSSRLVSYSYSFFGNWLQVGDNLYHRNPANFAKKFDDCFLLRIRQRNLLVISSPKLARGRGTWC
ncbi:hypothetical protein ACFX10_004231 [Malus domestica]